MLCRSVRDTYAKMRMRTIRVFGSSSPSGSKVYPLPSGRYSAPRLCAHLQIDKVKFKHFFPRKKNKKKTFFPSTRKCAFQEQPFKTWKLDRLGKEKSFLSLCKTNYYTGFSRKWNRIINLVALNCSKSMHTNKK